MAPPVWRVRGGEMPDSYTLGLKNFRSIEDATVKIAPLTVVYGPNGSGKSSLIYGLLTLRNFLTNPNQNIPSLFSYPSISLGGFQEVAHRHSANQAIALSIAASNAGEPSSRFTLTLQESGGSAELSFYDYVPSGGEKKLGLPNSISLDIAVPYQLNQQVDDQFTVSYREDVEETEDGYASLFAKGKLIWNGLSLAARLETDAPYYSGLIDGMVERSNIPMELARHTGFVPLRRGFSKPLHNLVSVTQALANEDEVASLLAGSDDRFLAYEISGFVEKFADRRIQPQGQIGTSMFSIDSIPVGKGTPASIVNEGFGINQLVYMLTICLYSRYKIVAIEEPEIHLHPSMVRELAIALAEIAVEKDRRLIVSTHSETFVVALLSQIAAGKIKTADVSFVHAENPNGSTLLTQQKANRNGQIEGGLRAFMASEAKDLVDFMGLSSE